MNTPMVPNGETIPRKRSRDTYSFYLRDDLILAIDALVVERRINGEERLARGHVVEDAIKLFLRIHGESGIQESRYRMATSPDG